MSRDDFYASPFGVAYSTYMERPRLSRLIARAVWGGDSRPYYESMGAIREAADGGTVVDCPCGAGVALRELDADRDLRYVAVDLSPSMLRRARERVARRNLRQVEVLQADATEIPLPDQSADLFLSYWGCTASTVPPPPLSRPPGYSSLEAGSSARPSFAAATACDSGSSDPGPATSATLGPRRRSAGGWKRLDLRSRASSARVRCSSSTLA
ncbi:MAG TPA: class I SAM-dependent methyltransferase [Solirubrobacterales bacterium]|nr:class I SAM-dependent methyltransferase [Solirubrobacterales bacterium]